MIRNAFRMQILNDVKAIVLGGVIHRFWSLKMTRKVGNRSVLDKVFYVYTFENIHRNRFDGAYDSLEKFSFLNIY